MITAENLSRTYGDFLAVDSVSFSIPRGAIVGLLGHNGAGKTTIMKMLTGFLEPSAGTASIDGVDIASDRSKVQEKIGYLPENSPLYPEMTVIEYLEYVAELREIPESSRKDAILRAIAQTHLEEKATSPIRTLSRGFKQRVGVAQAVIHEPEILILDEPTNGLDPTQINDMRKLIVSLSEKSTVIISTHILQEVQAICDQVMILSRGRLVLNSSLAELSTDNNLLIEADMGGSALKDMLSDIPTISKVEVLEELKTVNGNAKSRTISRVHLSNSDMSVAADISKRLVEKGCALYGLQREERNLESVFHEASSL